MIKKTAHVLLLSMIIMLLFGCTLTKTGTPTSTFDILSEQYWQIEGIVLDVDQYEINRIVIDFGEIIDQPDKIAYLARVSFTEDCRVWKLDGAIAQPASLSDLSIGQRIMVNPEYILEDYSIHAKEVLIMSPGAVESQTPISTFLTPQVTGTITSIEDYDKNFITKLIHLDFINSSLEPDVKKAVFALRTHSLAWQQSETGYHLISEDDLAVGQLVSILVYSYRDEISDRYPHQGSVEEVIVLR